MTREAGKTRDTGAPPGAPNPATGSRAAEWFCPDCGGTYPPDEHPGECHPNAVLREPTPDRAPARRSTTHAAFEALVRFSEEERLFGAAKAHESFDGILTEHALALDEIRRLLLEACADVRLSTPGETRMRIVDARNLLDKEITYIRALGSVAATEEEEDAK